MSFTLKRMTQTVATLYGRQVWRAAHVKRVSAQKLTNFQAWRCIVYMSKRNQHAHVLGREIRKGWSHINVTAASSSQNESTKHSFKRMVNKMIKLANCGNIYNIGREWPRTWRHSMAWTLRIPSLERSHTCHTTNSSVVEKLPGRGDEVCVCRKGTCKRGCKAKC